ncbi:hypothetical protein GA0070613_5202 [Micromonospora inositola]|uniref:Uncharacterized protein n=1 Tax=Micromonospora inositola TaxID=47865 RepID=A0A1C5JQT5_9ACTN|nr:hypothetical protein [Micromonospora inositola]SCG72955.1 hypothetical protein GA0070613_5202 [Micromonospora inositola]
MDGDQPAQPRQGPGRDAYRDLDAGLLVLQFPARLGPAAGQVEPGRARHRLLEQLHLADPGGPVGAALAVAQGDQIPVTGSEDEPEGGDLPGARPPVPDVPQAHPTITPDRAGELGQARHRLGRAVPADRVQVEPIRGPAGALPGLAGEAGPDLDPGALQHLAQAELLGRAGEAEERQRPGLVEADARQPGAVAAVQAVSARRPTGRSHRYPGRHQRLDVPLHGPLADLQLPGQLAGAGQAADLELEQEGHHPRGTHPPILTQIYDRRCRELG